jgi:hypothetical protein
MKQEEIKNIVEQIKSTLGIEELDELEREYNRLYKELKEKEEQSPSTQNAE